MLRPVLGKLASGERLDASASEAAFGSIIAGRCSDAEIAALLMAMRVRGETADELVGLVRAMRSRMVPVRGAPAAIDLCGTGGDGMATLNVSTATAIVVASCGVAVAKHGNRAVSSSSGAADVLAALGIDPDPPVESQSAALQTHGVAFLFAPRHHAGLAHARNARELLGTRSIFNLAGPLCNPASVRRQLLGVFDRRWLVPFAEALAALGTERAWVVHGGTGGPGGLDELTIAGPSEVVMLDHGRLSTRTVRPEEAGLAAAPVASIAGGDARYNAEALRRLLDGARSPYRDIVLLNSGAALHIAGRAHDLREGASMAAAAIDEGRASALLGRLRASAPVREREAS